MCNKTDMSMDRQMKHQSAWYETHDEHDLPTVPYKDELSKEHFELLLSLVQLQDGLYLEVGCGAGLHTAQLIDVVGIEQLVALDISLRRVRRLKANHGGMKVLVADVHHLPFRSDVFEGVFGFAVLHHVASIERTLSEVVRVTKPGGYIAFGEENNAWCPLNYILALVYRDWSAEKGLTRIRTSKLRSILEDLEVEDARFVVHGMTIAGLGKLVYLLTRRIEQVLRHWRWLSGFSAYVYFAGRKPRQWSSESDEIPVARDGSPSERDWIH